MSTQIGFGGGCHWCTEAVFQALRGVHVVEQGWASSDDQPERFAEAVIVHYDPSELPLDVLVGIHLHTHSCTSAHSLRAKYRSAVYCFGESQQVQVRAAIAQHQADFTAPIITEVVEHYAFRQNTAQYLDYYRSRPNAPFCERYISPKLRLLQQQYSRYYQEITPRQNDGPSAP